MTNPFFIPDPSVALADVEEVGRRLRQAFEDQVKAQFEADDMLEQLINSKIGSTNEMTGKPHSYSSAETWAKNSEEWRNCRREVVRLEGQIKWEEAQLQRATLLARLSVARVESKVRQKAVA